MIRWPWSVPERDALLDVLITPPVPKFTGHDEALALRTLARRAEADDLKRRARQLETRDEPQRLRRVR